MKQMINFHKATILSIVLTLIMSLSLTACGNKVKSTFPNIDDNNIPDVLETTVGTVGNTSFSSGITDTPDYESILTVTFKDTTEADYTSLMEHYQSTLTGKDEDGSLLFDWGRLQVMTDDNSISINAFIK